MFILNSLKLYFLNRKLDNLNQVLKLKNTDIPVGVIEGQMRVVEEKINKILVDEFNKLKKK